MHANQQESNGETRLAYILGVPLAENAGLISDSLAPTDGRRQIRSAG